MFGYVKPFRPELRMKELDAYKAVYCGLCGQLGRSYGPIARMTLSYDFTFISMLYWAVNAEKPQTAQRRCSVNPLKKIQMCTGGAALELSADIACILLYHKLLDNLRDGGVFTVLGCTLVRPLAARARRIAAGKWSAQDAQIADSMQRQILLEQQGCDRIDAACEPTALMLGGILGMLAEDMQQKRVLTRLGYLLGRYVYLCDALDDVEKDLASGSYNPIILHYGLHKGDRDLTNIHQQVAMSLNMTIGEAEKTLSLLQMHDFVPIIQNIIPMGLRATVEEILAKKKEITQ